MLSLFILYLDHRKDCCSVIKEVLQNTSFWIRYSPLAIFPPSYGVFCSRRIVRFFTGSRDLQCLVEA